jgi:quinol monooxygenase YgiN
MPQAQTPEQSTHRPAHCEVFELRQYTLHPGRREALIELFDRAFVETQEAAGMQVIGQFRDLDGPDRFVWLRGFADMAARRRALESFYGGPVWAEHRAAANATMIDSDNVLLLRPAWPGAAMALAGHDRPPPPGSLQPLPGLIDVTIFPLREPAGPALSAWCRQRMCSTLAEGGASLQAWTITEPSINDFPRLPVREGETVLVGIALFDSVDACERFQASGRWARDVTPGLSQFLAKPPQSLRLVPTARCALHA